MIQLISLCLISILILAFSWRSLKAPDSHGFYRFFSWEFIAALIALNVDHWFVQPFSWHQIVSWALLIISLIPLGLGVHSLKTKGQAAVQRENEPQLLGFERTTHLVTSGIYRYIRHPLYSSLLLLAWGVFFKRIDWLTVALALLATLSLRLTARADENECIHFFGLEYTEYMQHSKRFIPFIW